MNLLNIPTGEGYEFSFPKEANRVPEICVNGQIYGKVLLPLDGTEELIWKKKYEPYFTHRQRNMYLFRDIFRDGMMMEKFQGYSHKETIERLAYKYGIEPKDIQKLINKYREISKRNKTARIGYN